MLKRLTSGALAVLLFAGIFFANAMVVSADPTDPTDATQESTESTTTDPSTTTEPSTNGGTETPTPPEQEEEEDTVVLPPMTEYDGRRISSEGMRILKLEEGFSRVPYWDYSQWTVGYGTRCPEDLRAEFTNNGISEEAAEILLHNHLVGIYNDLNNYISRNGYNFSQNQFDALVLISYNCGTSWCFDANGTLPKALKSGATGSELVRSFAVWVSAGGEIKDYLIRRRLSESYMFLEGQYTKNPPSNYTYVLYNANGGTVKPKIQGYDSNKPAATFSVPTYSGYTFDGWYTQRTGGTKVTTLDASTKGKTLYAHWKTAQGEDVNSRDEDSNATVTSDGVNVRKGPGTNYTRVGVKNRGDQINITEVASGSGYRWGKIGTDQWICLTYTDYDVPADDTTTPSQPTTPPATETTTPPASEPTNPPAGSTSGVMGTVSANGGLNVRSGAGTNYGVVSYVANQARVEILEQKTVGAITWGRISNGWISMSYVKLDGANNSGSNTGSGNNSTTTQSQTGTIINCTEFLRIRKGPGTNYAIEGYLDPGDRVTITETKQVGSENWGKIDRGWISMYYVRLDSGSSNSGSNTGSGNNSTTTQTQTGTVTASTLCVRESAGTSSVVKAYLTAGTRVTITQTTSVNGTTWGKMDKGWISLDYVKMNGTTDNSGTNSGNTGNTGATQSVTGKITSKEYLNVRSGAGTDYSVVGSYYSGDSVTITEQKTVGATTWGKTNKGWISMTYVRLDSSGDNSTTTQGEMKTVTASCLCIRRTAGTGTVVGYLYNGAKVTILETTAVNGVSWGRTSQGWICMTYVK